MGKMCSACRQNKGIAEFQKRAASVDGLTASCKSCLQKRDAARYVHEKARRAELHRRYLQTPRGKKAHRRATVKWINANRDKRVAHARLQSALRGRRIMKMPCEICGALKVEGHHDDYAKPLVVRWLCARHHAEHHGTK